jgi:hypothetical protein
MHRSELEQFVECLECGVPFDPELGHGYVLDPNNVLCRICAARRGGQYDDADDCWSRAPNTADLEHRLR